MPNAGSGTKERKIAGSHPCQLSYGICIRIKVEAEVSGSFWAGSGFYTLWALDLDPNSSDHDSGSDPDPYNKMTGYAKPLYGIHLTQSRIQILMNIIWNCSFETFEKGGSEMDVKI